MGAQRNPTRPVIKAIPQRARTVLAYNARAQSNRAAVSLGETADADRARLGTMSRLMRRMLEAVHDAARERVLDQPHVSPETDLLFELMTMVEPEQTLGVLELGQTLAWHDGYLAARREMKQKRAREMRRVGRGASVPARVNTALRLAMRTK